LCGLLKWRRRRDTDQVRRLMLDHIDEAGGLAAELAAAVRQRFVRDADLQARILPPGREAVIRDRPGSRDDGRGWSSSLCRGDCISII
jgi:hypothetical protein